MLGIADVGAQSITCPGEPWDCRRTLSMASWGVVWYGGPQVWLWTRVYPQLIGRGTMAQAVASGFSDCCLNVPFLLLPCFYIWTGLIKGQTFQTSCEHLRAEWYESCTGMAAFWLPFQVLNMRFTPPHLQTFLVSLANIVNKTWLSWLSNRRRVRQRQEEQEQLLAMASSRSITKPISFAEALPQQQATQPAGHAGGQTIIC
mmetsp:Transcript_46141/g.124416  ORF Transcript_46141/g.124416 Transcript_46141/m.124416 type:complete len:202 (+) Transcript_46141:2-607(+)